MLLGITAGIDFSAYALSSSGKCGDNITWSFNSSTGKLTISGSGYMYDYNNEWDMDAADAGGISPFRRDGMDVIKSVTIGSGIYNVGKYAFWECDKITSVSLPSTINTIGIGAFERCTNLTSISLPSNLLIINESAFSNSGLTSISLPSSVSSIGENAFSCTKIKSVVIPKNVRDIGKEAFGHIYNLNEISVNESNSDYSSLNGVLFNKAKTLLVQYPIGNTSTSYTVPNGVTTLGEAAFYSANNLKNIILPNTLDIIENNALSSCTSLTELDIPDSVTVIKKEVFYGCSSLKKLIIPSSIISIGGNNTTFVNNLESIYISSLYDWCKIQFESNPLSIAKNLYINGVLATDVLIPDGITKINNRTFSGCACMKNVTIPNSVKYIGVNAFSGCTGLTRITIPNSVLNIATGAFASCKNITSVSLPESVAGLGSNAFSNCSSLTSIVINNKNCEIYDSTYTINSTATIYGYKNSTAEAYANKYSRTFVALDVDEDTTKPTGSITSTNNVAATQTVTFSMSDNVGIAGYYWGTNSNYASNTFTTSSATSVSKTVSSAGTYYLTVKDTSGNVSNTVSVTFYKTTLDANGGSVSPSSVLTRSGNSFTFPVPSRSGYTYQGWNTSSSATSGVATLTPTSNSTYYAVWKANSTSYSYSIGDVTYSFDNSRESFEYPYNYVIPYSSFTIIYGDNTYARQLYRWWAEDSWGGNCYGMALTSSMFVTNNDVNVSTYKSGATKISQLSPKDKDSSSINLTTFIEAMMVSQSDSSIQRGTITNNLEKLYSEVENVSKTGMPVPVGVIGYLGGHEILAYGVNKVSNTDYRIKVYDNNWPNQERYIYLTANSSGKFTSWKYTLWDGCTFSSSNGGTIDYTPYSVYYNVWKNGSNDATSRSAYNTLITNSKDIEIYDFEDNKVASVEDGVLQSSTNDIYVVNRKGLLKNASSQVSSTTIVMPTDLYTIKNTDNTVDEFKATMVNLDRSSTVSTESDSITFAVDDSCNMNNTEIHAKAGEKYSITLDSSDQSDNEQVSVSGVSTGQTIQASQIKGSISLNNCPGAKISINGTDIGSSSGGTSILGGSVFFEEKTLAYSGSAVSPKISVVVNGTTLKEGIDYVPYYSNNTNIGTGHVTVYGIGEYSGTLNSDFNIVKAQIADSEISGLNTVYEYTKKAIAPSIKIKYNSITLKKDQDYTVSLINNVNQGTATIIINGIGNYTGSKTATFTIKCNHKATTDEAVPSTFTATGKTVGSHCSVCGAVIKAQQTTAKLGSPKMNKLKKGKKSFTAMWSKSSGVDGYQVQYSLKKNFKGAKTKWIKKDSTKLKVKKLKSKKTYYVRVRAYKKINGKNVYSNWSTKKVKTK